MLHASPFFRTLAPAKGTIATRVVPGVNNTEASRHEGWGLFPQLSSFKDESK